MSGSELAAITLAQAASPSATPSAVAEADFHPVTGDAAPSDGRTELVAAYVLMWVLLLGFVWLTWNRQRRLAARLTELERALTPANSDSEQAPP